MPHLSAVEMLVALALMAASAALFIIRLRPILTRIRSARAEPGYHLHPLAPRVRDFFTEVLLQAKVIRQRPLAGIAHALVFWGFCAFGLITLNHFAAGFGFPFLPEAYQLVIAPLAAAVAIAIAGLAARRLIVRPKWLGDHVSWESGFIALLIFTLMATFLWALATPSSKPVWWLHTLALLIFLPLIPHTKHLHLALSPFTVFLKRQGFSQIPPLAGDEDFGLDTGKDITQPVALQAYTCVECGRCMEHCPANLTGKLLNPKEIALGTRRYLNEFGPASAEPLLGKHLAAEAAFQCTTCGACEFQCPVGVQHLPLIVGLRRGAVNTGKWEDDYGTKLFLNLERNGNPLGFSASERDKFIQKQGFAMYDGTQDYCLWLGCMGAYDPQGREIVASLAKVMRHLNVTFGVLKKEKCSGDSARRLGNDLVFQSLAEANLETMKQHKVTRLVSICPHCVRTISMDWKEVGEAPPIEHHSEFLARHAAQLPPAARGSLTFHDPCYLGRYRDVYAAPRETIARFGTLVEPARTRERSFCCGAGGGLAFLGEEKGKRVSVERAEQLAATGAGTVVAACPFCNSMFKDALATVSNEPPKLLDIAQLAAASIEQPGAPA